MFLKSSIELNRAGSAGQLVLDYLSGRKELSHFFSFPPTAKGFSSFLGQNPYGDLDRSLLANVLEQQASLVKNTSKESRANITLLRDKKTFSVTTGHQLCLFTGPLYFIYKIATTIALARELKKKHPAHHFVPVYWMATEDHDFEEVNHFYVNGRKLTWHTEERGAVGHFSTTGLNQVLTELDELIGKTEHGDELVRLFRETYLGHNNLSVATRFLVNALFGEQGIVVLDPDEKALKELFRDEMRQDLFEGLPRKQIERTSGDLQKLGYSPQVHPREVNLFLLKKNNRVRIDRAGNDFVCGDERLSPEEVEHLVLAHPEKLSPNVSLRPLYQQKILPNLAYVGGPGELAYWLQYKSMFDACSVPFPILMPRNFFTVLDSSAHQKVKKSGVNEVELFLPLPELLRRWQKKNGLESNAEEEKEQLKIIYRQLASRAHAVDPTLDKHVDALLKRQLKKIDELTDKLNRAMRRRSEAEITRVTNARDLIFPMGSPQERVLNFSTYYLLYGSGFISAIVQNTDPFAKEHFILREK
jgi:bacillithiol synthase